VTGARTDELIRRDEGGVVWVTLNRPETGNALTPSMRDGLTELMLEVSGDLGTRAVVITGAGEKGFCTGADLRGGGRGEGGGAAGTRTLGDVARMISRGWQRLVASILDCEKPVIAGVNAAAAGGGCHLALACDLVVMAEEARFIEVFVRRGIIPDAGGAYLLPRLIGPARAKEMMFLGDEVGAAEALRIGLVNRVVPRADLDKTVSELAARLAAGPTKAIAVAKRLVNASLESDRATAFSAEAVGQEMINATEDAREGMRAFAERREPEFKGR